MIMRHFQRVIEPIVFLQRYEGPIADNAYVILGGYEGKFKIDGNKVVPPILEEVSDLNAVHTVTDLQLN